MNLNLNFEFGPVPGRTGIKPVRDATATQSCVRAPISSASRRHLLGNRRASSYPPLGRQGACPCAACCIDGLLLDECSGIFPPNTPIELPAMEFLEKLKSVSQMN